VVRYGGNGLKEGDMNIWPAIIIFAVGMACGVCLAVVVGACLPSSTISQVMELEDW